METASLDLQTQVETLPPIKSRSPLKAFPLARSATPFAKYAECLARKIP